MLTPGKTVKLKAPDSYLYLIIGMSKTKGNATITIILLLLVPIVTFSTTASNLGEALTVQSSPFWMPLNLT
jgi:hypothetical protein